LNIEKKADIHKTEEELQMGVKEKKNARLTSAEEV
jgi:hypothetical protein